MVRFPAPTLVLGASALVAGATLAAPVAGGQPTVSGREKPVITVGGLRFHDLNGDGVLTPYEDWRRTADARADDLLARMTLAEKAGTMMHATLPGAAGALGRSSSGYDLAQAGVLVRDRHVTSMISRLTLPPVEMARQDNAVQALAEATRLGIPVTISTDPRNHFQDVVGASGNAAGTSRWPETLGFAALRDPALVRRFAAYARAEYRAVGLHQALSPQLDLASEPRWSRINQTFGSDPKLTSALGAAYVQGFQGGADGLRPDGVLAVAKHWVGYGAAPEGFDAHNHYGRFARVGNRLALHAGAFRGALDSHVGAVMPAYPILSGATVRGKAVEPVGAGYSKRLLRDFLRGEFGFDGVILSDWAITTTCNARCRAPTRDAPQRPEDIATSWGVDGLSVEQRYALAIDAGVDQFGGTDDVQPLLDAVRDESVSEARIDRSVRRILVTKFRLGLFENAYVDPAKAAERVGTPEAVSEADATQRAAQVVLQNRGLLPAARMRAVWLFGVDPAAARAAGLRVVDDPAEADFAIVRAATPHRMLHPDWFFGSRQHEGPLDFREGDPAFEALKRVGPRVPTLLAIFMDRPAILTNVQPLANAIVVNFGASDAALLDVALGRAQARGRMPFELPRTMAAVERQDPAVPDDSRDPLYLYGAGFDSPMAAPR